jgi:hypothetical protein
MFGAMSAISSGIQLASGIIGKTQHDKYANLIEDQELEMPGAIGKAESIYDQLASQGLPGKETIQGDIESMIPANLSVAKEVVDSPSALIDLIGKTSAQTSDQMRKLGVADASAKVQNQAQLGSFLSQVKAPMEMDINKFGIERDLSAQRERMAGWSELTQGVAGASNIGMKYFGDVANEDYMTKLMKMISGIDDDGGSRSADGSISPLKMRGYSEDKGILPFGGTYGKVNMPSIPQVGVPPPSGSYYDLLMQNPLMNSESLMNGGGYGI